MSAQHLPPRGKPPIFDKHKRLAYYQQKALALGLDPEIVKIPGANVSKSAHEVLPPDIAIKAVALKKMQKDTTEYTIPKVVPVETYETDEEIVIRIAARFNTLQKLMHGACEGKHRAIMVSGAGGVGKTFTAERIIDHYVETKGLKARIVKGGIVTPINLVKLLWDTREEGSVLLLDDADNAFSDPQSLALLKGALDSSDKRVISWMAESRVLKDEGISQTFEFKGTVIFITNIDMQAVIDAGRGSLVAHLQALVTRVHYLDLKLHSDRELVLWIEHMIVKNHILVSQKELTHNQEMEVLEWMLENRENLRSLSIRTALHVAEYVTEYKDSWKQVATDLILR